MRYRDTAGEHKDTALNGGNAVFKSRASFTARSRKVEVICQLHNNLFFQDKLMVNGLDVKIKLIRNKDTFCLMSGDAENYKVNILLASLFVKRIKVSPVAHLTHAETLLTSNAKYSIERVALKVFSIPACALLSNTENIFF